MSLVIKKFKLDPTQETFMELECRESGPVNFFLNLLKLDSSLFMKCDNGSIDYVESSLKGTAQKVIPLAAISSVTSSIYKNIKLFFAGVVGLILFLIMLIYGLSQYDGNVFIVIGAIALVVAIFCFVKYVLTKQIGFAIHNGGDKPAAMIICNPAVIAGERIDSKKFDESVRIIRDKINNVHK